MIQIKKTFRNNLNQTLPICKKLAKEGRGVEIKIIRELERCKKRVQNKVGLCTPL